MFLLYRAPRILRLFILISFTGLFTYVALALYSYHMSLPKFNFQQFRRLGNLTSVPNNLKNILFWGATDRNLNGRSEFIKRECIFTNCFLSTNKSLLGSYTKFDAVVINVSLINWTEPSLPVSRDLSQKYVFYSRLPAMRQPVFSELADNLFNWTWSYKFTSTIFSPFMDVRDHYGYVVAPKKYKVDWMEAQNLIKERSKNRITEPPPTEFIRHSKSKAMAMIIKNCNEDEYTAVYKSLSRLINLMKTYSLEFDIYGCDHRLQCPKSGCMELIKKDYFFYYVYEISLEFEYLTDDVVDALNHDVVPVLTGTPDFSMFIPDYSYVEYAYISEEKLVNVIREGISNNIKYNSYFAWKKYYTIQKLDPLSGLCDLCRLLNNNTAVNTYSNYKNFRTWWYPRNMNKDYNPLLVL